MTNTATGVPAPLRAAWGEAASAEELARVLLPPATALPAPPAGAAAWDGLAHGEPLAAVREQGEAERGTAWPQPLASRYVRFFRDGDGDRTAYESAVFDRQDRLTRAVLMAAATRSGSWLDEAADGLVLLCEQSSWCWPAHEDTCRPRGTVLPDPAAPCLDLGAADVAAQLAWADHVLAEPLDERYPGLRERICAEVDARVLEPFDRRRDWHWLGLDGDVHNWCPWICGNVLVAALRLAEPGERRARLVAWAVAGIDRYLASLPGDGSVDEGYEYWWNGAARALEALEVLEHATDGALGAAGVPVVRQTVLFPHRMHLGGPWYVNVADARARPSAGQPWHVPYRWGRRLGEPDAVRHARSQREPGIPASAELGRALAELADAEWQAAGPAEPPLVAGVWLPDVQLGLARTAAGIRRGPALVVKGGHNAEHHNHNDVGSVIVAVDGVPVLADAGRPTYTAQTFGADRYSIWTMQSSWHNVPEVRGTPQGQGARFRARDVAAADGPERFEVRLDLAAAYPVRGLERWLRTAALDRAAARVTVADSWAFAEDGSPPVAEDASGDGLPAFTGDGSAGSLHYLLAGRVEGDPAEGRLVVRPPDGARAALVSWDPSRVTAALTVRTLEDPMLSGVWGERLTRLELRLPGTARGTFEIGLEVWE